MTSSASVFLAAMCSFSASSLGVDMPRLSGVAVCHWNVLGGAAARLPARALVKRMPATERISVFNVAPRIAGLRPQLSRPFELPVVLGCYAAQLPPDLIAGGDCFGRQRSVVQ